MWEEAGVRRGHGGEGEGMNSLPLSPPRFRYGREGKAQRKRDLNRGMTRNGKDGKERNGPGRKLEYFNGKEREGTGRNWKKRERYSTVLRERNAGKKKKRE